MRQIRWSLLVALLLVTSAWGQRSDTVYDTALSGVGALGPSRVLYNIGQNAHLLYTIFTNAPTQVCATPAADVGLEGSFDGVIYTRIVSITNVEADPLGNLVGSIVGSGAFPYLRANARAFDTVHCRLTAYYSGSLGGQTTTTVVASSQYNTTNYLKIDFATAGAHAIIPGLATAKISIYELLLWNVTSQNISFLDGATALTGTFASFCSFCGVLLPAWGSPKWTLGTGNAFGITTSAATQVSGYVRYKYE
jgi:hypothetical protein